jgi:hypothetical protein
VIWLMNSSAPSTEWNGIRAIFVKTR